MKKVNQKSSIHRRSLLQGGSLLSSSLFYLGFHEVMPKTIKCPKDLLLCIIRRDILYNIVFQRVRVVDLQCPLPCNR